jgi:hypothetical protein
VFAVFEACEFKRRTFVLVHKAVITGTSESRA